VLVNPHLSRLGSGARTAPRLEWLLSGTHFPGLAAIHIGTASLGIRNVSVIDGPVVPGKRDELAGLRGHPDLRELRVWKEIQQVSHPFHEGLVSLFLKEDQKLAELTMEYGIF
jgi:hypothetical protein